MKARNRRRLYMRALKRFKKHYFYYGDSEIHFHTPGLCVALSDSHIPRTYEDCLRFSDLIELQELKPPRLTSHQSWWSMNEVGFMIRVMALEHMIERTYENEKHEWSFTIQY